MSLFRDIHYCSGDGEAEGATEVAHETDICVRHWIIVS